MHHIWKLEKEKEKRRNGIFFYVGFSRENLGLSLVILIDGVGGVVWEWLSSVGFGDSFSLFLLFLGFERGGSYIYILRKRERERERYLCALSLKKLIIIIRKRNIREENKKIKENIINKILI